MASNPITLPQNLALAPVPASTAKAAEVQVSSTDILDEAHSLKATNLKGAPQTIRDIEELRSFQLAKRRDYEQQLNKNRLNYGQWMRYAKWEIDHNHDFKRARSIMERALEVNAQHVPFWVRYIELELLHKNVNHARNLLDRAVTTLPRTDKLWYIYCRTEETLGHYAGVRSVFERWLAWRPARDAWESYIAFEERYHEHGNVRRLMLRYVAAFGDERAWKRWIVFESTLPAGDAEQTARTRGVFEGAADHLLQAGAERHVSEIVGLWTAWEAAAGEAERARAIFDAVLGQPLPQGEKYKVLQLAGDFEKNHGGAGRSDAPYLQRKLRYEQQVAADPRDHEAWWEYAQLEEKMHGARSAIGVLEHATAAAPAAAEKSTAWRRYVFLWIKLALYHEYQAGDCAKARETWARAVAAVPHQQFTFGKLWVMWAEFELRHSARLEQPRRVLGRAIGQTCHAPKRKVFRYYVALEKRAGEWARVRRLYEKWLEACAVFDRRSGAQTTPAVLEEYVAFERAAGEADRAAALYALGVEQLAPASRPLFAGYIAFLAEEFRYDTAREAFRRRLAAHDSAAVWVQAALFESSVLSPAQLAALEAADAAAAADAQFEVGEHHVRETRRVFDAAYGHYRAAGDGAGAKAVVEAWAAYEQDHGSAEQQRKVRERMPTATARRRTAGGVEEVYQAWEFPAAAAPALGRFLANAKKWAASNAA